MGQPNKVVDIFTTPLPASLAPTDYVRRWDHAAIASLSCFALTFALVGWGMAHTVTIPTYGHINTMSAWLTLGTVPDTYFEFTRFNKWLHVAGVVPWLFGLLAGWLAGKHTLKPYNHLRHISGHRRLNGQEAIDAAIAQSDNLRGDLPAFMRLHPSLKLPKTMWTRHGFLYGSVGSGKTVILSYLLDQIIKKNLRAMIYDVKGDFTQMFSHHPGVRILCPWDERSVRWDIASDVDTPARAAAFISGLIPVGDDSTAYWAEGARSLHVGVLLSLQNEKQKNWGFREYADRLLMAQPELHALMLKHYPVAANLIAAPQGKNPTDSMMSNLASTAKLIVDLAQAWDDNNRPAFSWRKWATARPLDERQIFVQPGPDRDMSGKLMAAMVNVIAETVVSPELQDDELGRSLFFLFDEVTSIGKFDLPTLIDKGRSKGAMVWCGCQSLEQIKSVYGDNIAVALTGMVGTHVVCQVQMSETRKQIAELFGYRRVANLLPTQSFGKNGTSASLAVKDEPRAVIDATQLTEDLGVRRGPQYKDGFAVRAIVSLGNDPLTLEWEGKKWPKPNVARIPATWTLGVIMSPKTWRALYGVEGTDRSYDTPEGRAQIAKMIKDAVAQRKRYELSKLLDKKHESSQEL